MAGAAARVCNLLPKRPARCTISYAHCSPLARLEEVAEMTRPTTIAGARLLNISIACVTMLLVINSTMAQQMNSGITSDNTNDSAIKLRTNMVNLNVSVIDPDGHFVRGLSKDNFE